MPPGRWGVALSQMGGLKFFALGGDKEASLWKFICLFQVKFSLSIGKFVFRVVSWNQNVYWSIKSTVF